MKDPSAVTSRNVWWKHLFGVLHSMEAKHGLHKKKIFDGSRHLKYGFGGVWWKYHGRDEHKTNEEILKMVETEGEIMDTVRSRQKRWLGHILRHDSLLRIKLEGQIEGKKAYGRPRTMMLDWLLKTKEGNISYEELKMSAQGRSRWSQWRCKPAIWQNTAEIQCRPKYVFVLYR